MTNPAKQHPPPANWQDFESLCHRVWREILNDPGTQKNGRPGHEQHGVDVYGYRQDPPGWVGVQCKGKDNFTDKKVTATEIDKEVAKARSFEPTLSEFILATTAPRDAGIQDYARKISDESRAAQSFSVTVWSWEDIIAEFDDLPNVVKWYHGTDQWSVSSTSSVLVEKVDFLISYAGSDHEHAQRLQRMLDEYDFSVILQPWPLPSAEHMVEQAARSAKRVIGILTEDYDETALRVPSWRAYFANGPQDQATRFLLAQLVNFRPRNLPMSPAVLDLTRTFDCGQFVEGADMLIQAFRSQRAATIRLCGVRKDESHVQFDGGGGTR
ncbi:MAG: TIR domain-containing protein [Planctomycetaceae bacterium]